MDDRVEDPDLTTRGNSDERADQDMAGRIAASSAIKSLLAEQEVAEVLRSHSWRTTHGFYYLDPKQGKTREMDVVGSLTWERRVVGGSEGAGVTILIECKSVPGYHVVFPALRHASQHHFPEWWSGEKHEHQARLARVLLSNGIDRKLADDILRAFDETAWPENISCVASYRTTPFPPKYACSTFCETNVGKKRDPEDSVIWKAGEGLRSAIRGLQRQKTRWLCEGLGRVFEHANSSEDSQLTALTYLERSVRYVTMYNPAVVIDSSLWVLDGESVRSVPSFRFLQHDAYGSVDWWFDVVNRAHFAEYAREFTSSLNERMNWGGARVRGGNPKGAD